MKRGQISAGGRYDKFQLNTGRVQQEPLSEPDVRVPDDAWRLACFWSFSAQCSKSWKFNIAEANKNSDAAETWWAPPSSRMSWLQLLKRALLFTFCLVVRLEDDVTVLAMSRNKDRTYRGSYFFFQCSSTILHPKQLIQNCRVSTKCNKPLFTHSQDPLVLSYIASNMATLNKTKLCVSSYYYIGCLRRQSLPCGVIPA